MVFLPIMLEHILNGLQIVRLIQQDNRYMLLAVISGTWMRSVVIVLVQDLQRRGLNLKEIEKWHFVFNVTTAVPSKTLPRSHLISGHLSDGSLVKLRLM